MSVARSQFETDTAPVDASTRAGGPDWPALAREVATEFRKTIIARERANTPPTVEIQRLRDSRLVNLLIPKRLGGEGGTVGDAARVIREITQADGSLGFLLSFHYAHSSMPRQIAGDGDSEHFDRLSAQNRWFWGNVLGPFHISGEPTANGGLIAYGTKHMCSGASLGNVIKIMGKWTDRDEMFFAVVPADRAGIRFHDDWDGLGLRSTATQTVTLERIVVEPHEVVRPKTPLSGFAAFANFGVFSAAFYLGVLTGALEETREYLRATPSNPRPLGGNFSLPIEDPFIQLEYGKAWIELQALEALFEQQIRQNEWLWEHRQTISPEERGAIARRDTALQIRASQLAVDFGSKLFELTGGRSIARQAGFDRFWRDARAYSVHHPSSYLVKGIGEWALGVPPKPPALFDIRRQFEARTAHPAPATVSGAPSKENHHVA